MPIDLPKNEWEMINIIDQKSAVAEEKVETSKSKYYVKVVAEAIMVSRNIKFRTLYNEPVC
ncbi:MAG TPA: hypothetical protein ENG40_03260 [Thermoprotei archaeon]|nr:hypothetical protein [Thermoprotei archaeon]